MMSAHPLQRPRAMRSFFLRRSNGIFPLLDAEAVVTCLELGADRK